MVQPIHSSPIAKAGIDRWVRVAAWILRAIYKKGLP